MDEFIKFPAAERTQFFSVSADRLGLPVHIIEKDFWVCWTLDLLFSLDEIGDVLTFKGGTSLSKVYHVIKRFSEDIDLSIEKSFFGFMDERDPENAGSNKKRNALLAELSKACRAYVNSDILGALSGAMSRTLQDNESWSLSVDSSDPDRQTLIFEYPPSGENVREAYVSPVIKIEFGARGEHWPVSNRVIKTYLEESVEDSVNSSVEVRVLNVERTFWEKATILHMFAHYPEDKKVPIRQSRHYYDLYCLLESNLCESAKSDKGLLDRVAEHKSIYFRAAWAKYELAKPATLRLIPDERVLKEMAEDYKRMESMFFDSPPDWEKIISVIRSFENDFNSIRSEQCS